MRSSPIIARAMNRTGFSLIEIMLALAVIAIGLIAVVGLIPRGIQASRDAADNTLAATIAHDELNDIRSQPFSQVDLGDGSGVKRDLTTYAASISSPTFLYYDSSGFPTNKPNAYYGLGLTFQPQPNLPITWVTAMVMWPANSSSPTTNFFATQIANYQN